MLLRTFSTNLVLLPLVIRFASIALGGAIGAVCRYWLSNAAYQLLGRGFPYGTLIVNVLGSLVMGLLYVLLIERMDISPEWRAIMLVGFLGAFTTFSTFSMETVNLIESGEQLKALLNVVLSAALCVTACWSGTLLGRQL